MQTTPYIPPETNEEAGQVDLLLDVMGQAVNRTEALRVYRKHKGNVERAIDAILSGDRGEDYNWDEAESSALPGYSQSTQQIGPQPLKPSTTVIDLTGEEDDLHRAMAMSLESETTFGPSNRPPDSNWAMVPTNQSGNNAGLSNEDKSYHDAIQASLEEFASTNESDFIPVGGGVREGGRPVAMRSENPSLAYAALLIQSLYAIPQVRERVACIELPHIRPEMPRNSPGMYERLPIGELSNVEGSERAMWNLMEVFANLDLAQLAAIVDSDALPSLMAPPLTDHHLVAHATAEFVKVVAEVVEGYLKVQRGDSHIRLLEFTHGRMEVHRRSPRAMPLDYPQESQVVLIEYGNEKNPYTDLISCLSGILSSWTETGSSHDVIIEPSEVFCFHLRRAVNQTGKYSTEPFTFPKLIYLDQFLFQNLELANETRLSEKRIMEEILELSRMKEGLTRHNNRDIIKDLEGTLYYYENVAQPGDDLERAEILKKTKEKLQNVITGISRKIEAIEYKIEKLQAEVENIYNIPQLQLNRYDLRAVLMHTGLPGRKQIYSYVQDNHGIWWKTVDYTVTEVPEETVFSDSTGLHLGAGPYMLLYSRHVNIENITSPQWPRVFTESVEKHNQLFLSSVPHEMAVKAGISFDNSPPPPPSPSPVPLVPNRRLKSE